MAGFGPRVDYKPSGGGDSQPVVPVGSTQVPGDTALPDPGWQEYSEAVGVVPGSETTVLTFVVQAAPPITHIQMVAFGGQNIATYYLYFDDVRVNQYITYWSGPFDGRWSYENTGGGGFEIPVGTVVKVTVLHNRPDNADFYARVQGLYVN